MLIFYLGGITANVPALGEVAKFVTDYFLLKIKFLAKLKGDFYYKIRNLAKRMLCGGCLVGITFKPQIFYASVGTFQLSNFCFSVSI
ncbi:hypothetical protein DOS84_18750 [Flavobacterium aquariorum]|uniref:Uncharacterized protein n=1 Tax=Flavobacterium aquariorum TaxID=2217670 RepID=A0A2W7TQE3_9FLAO|nr:hypothetical protein DOS84_18750 [Flavobacterium aquariorum]